MAPLCEVRVFSRRQRYAGTLDVLGLWRGVGALIDYKTGHPRDVCADLQTAAYVGALLDMLKRGDTPERVVFDPVPHSYTLDGELLPSVTQVLHASGAIDFSHVPQPIMLAARDRGSAVHNACHYYNEDDLDVDAFRDEFPDYWPYVSAWIDFRRDSGFEIATSFEQLASIGLIRRYAVQLRRDGTYRVEAYRGVSDYADFLTLLRAQEIVARHRGAATVAAAEWVRLMRITLNAAEQRIVRWVAKQRSESNRAQGIVDARVGPQSSEESDVLGFGAEVAFCKLFNVYPDFDVRPRRGTADCARFGETVDIKATTYANGRLLAVPRKDVLAADVYALVVVEWPAFRFAGFARAAELLSPDRLTDLGHGPTYAIEQEHLSTSQLLTADEIHW